MHYAARPAAPRALPTGPWRRAAPAGAGLWRGTPLEDVPCQALRDAWLPRLDQQRVQVIEWHIEAGLQLGRHEHLVPQLRQLTADHPLRERFHGQLMRALARCGRQAEALDAYQDARKTLAGDLGIEPGPELRRLHEQILAGQDDPQVPHQHAAAAASASAQVTAVRRQLPAAARHFIGRRDEMDLITALPGPSRQPDAHGGSALISAIDGMAGIGKTTQAVHAAQGLAGRFPDGQLFIDLRGYTQGQPPREPDEALGTLLRAASIRAAQIPAPFEERAALYRLAWPAPRP